MPVAIPLIAAGVGAAGSVATSAMNNSAASSAQDKQIAQAQATAAAASAAADKANNSQQTQATNQIQQQQQQFANAYLNQGLVNNQNALTSQLQTAAAGGGPNPALDQLNQQTSTNTQNQAALQAGQRGAGANVGLAARNAGLQGAANQQNAVGQAATLEANQQIAARNQLQQQLGTLGSQGLQAQQGAASTALGNQQITTGATTGAAQQGTSAMNNAMGNNAGLAGQQIGLQNNAIGAGLGAVGTGISAFAGPGGSSSGMSPATAAGYGSSTTASNPNAANGDFSMLAQGGMAGDAGQMSASAQVLPSSHELKGGAKSFLARHLNGMSASNVASDDTMKFAQGGKVPALVSPGERYLNPKQAKMVAAGKADPMKAGVKVPGKAKVKGNSYANDTVPATLETGGIVIPKSVMESKNPKKEAAKFVAAIMAKHQGLRK